MKLMTKELEKEFAKPQTPQYSADSPICIAKFFNPCGSQTWWATEYNSKDRIFFGFVTGMAYDEWGYFSLTELEELKVGFCGMDVGLGIERDLYFTSVPIKQALKDYYGKEIL